MIEQIGSPISFDAFFTVEGVGKTGLADVVVDVYRGATKVVADGAAIEIGSGLYTYELASGSVTAKASYRAVFKTADATVDQKHLPALWTVGQMWVERSDAAVSAAVAAPAAALAAYDPPTRAELTLDKEEILDGMPSEPATSSGIAGAVWSTLLPGLQEPIAASDLVSKLDVGTPATPVVPVPGPAADLSLCRVYGYLETLDNLPAVGAVITFTLVPATYAGGLASERVIYGRAITATADADGFVQVDLQRNDLLTPAGSKYLVNCADCGWVERSLTLASDLYDLKTLAV